MNEVSNYMNQSGEGGVIFFPQIMILWDERFPDVLLFEE